MEISFGTWRKLSYNVLKKAKLLIAPTDSTKEIFQKYYPDLVIKTIEHGVEKLEYEYERKEESEKKNIAFLGGINKIKGIDFLKKFVDEANREDSKYQVHLFGSTSEDELNESNGNYYYHGKYKRENIVKEMKENHIDIVVLLAIWPETYSYTLTESLMAKVPVLALDYGAIAERISKYEYGWILPKDVKFEDVLKKLNDIFENKEDYNKKLSNIEKYLQNLKSVREMAKEYEEVYSGYLKENQNTQIQINQELFLNILKNSKDILKQENELERCYESIEEYHYTVMEYRKEIDRLNKNIEEYKKIEGQYNHLVSSRKLQMLKKIKFIEF